MRPAAGLLLALALGSAAALEGQARGRIVQIELFRAKDAPAIRLSIRENETLVTTVEDVGTLAFEVRFRDRQDKIVLVVIFDADSTPHVLLGATEVPTDGKRVESDTSPPFGLRVRRVEAAR